jgi:uncharacterized membrane protein SirB2
MLPTTVLIVLAIFSVIFMIMGLVILADKAKVSSPWEKKVPGTLLLFSGVALSIACIIDIIG